MERAWFIDGEFAFDLHRCFFPRSDGNTDAKAEIVQEMLEQLQKRLTSSRCRRNPAERGDVGVVFMPKKRRMGYESTLGMLGTMHFVPENVKTIVVVNTLRVGGVDVKQMALDVPGNVILADFLEGAPEALYDAEDFEPTLKDWNGNFKRSWTVHGMPSGVTGRTRDGMDALFSLAHVNRMCNIVWRSESTATNELLRECHDAAGSAGTLGKCENAEIATRYRGAVQRVRVLSDMLSFGEFEPKLLEGDENLQSIMVQVDSVAELVSHGELRVKNSTWDDWRQDFQDSARTDVWDWEICSASSAELDDAATLRDIKRIWDTVLESQNSMLRLPDGASNWFRNVPEQETALEAVRQLGRVYGIDARVHAYLAGVPMEDILA